MSFKKHISLVLIGMIFCIPTVAFATGGKVNIQFEASCVAADGSFSAKAFVEGDEVAKANGGQNVSAGEAVLTYPSTVVFVDGTMGSDVFPDVVIQNDYTEAGKWKLMFGKVGYYNPVTIADQRKPFAIMNFKIPAGKKISDLSGALSTVSDPVPPRVFNDQTENVYGKTVDLVLTTLVSCVQPAAVVNPPVQPAPVNPPAPVLPPGQDIHQPAVQNQNAAPPVIGGAKPSAQTPVDAHAAATGANTQTATTSTTSTQTSAVSQPGTPSVPATVSTTSSVVQTTTGSVVTAPQPAAYHNAADLQATGPAEDLMIFALIGAGIWTFYRFKKSINHYQA